MNNLMEHILAVRNYNWQEVIIPIIIFAVIILKKLFSVFKDYADQYNEPKQEQETPKHHYDKDDFVTLEELRARKLSKIRAAYGIPEPKEQAPAEPMPEAEPELEEVPVQEQYFEPPPIRRQPPPQPVPQPVKVPKKEKKVTFDHVVPDAYKESQPLPPPHPHPQQQVTKAPKKAEKVIARRETVISLSSQQDLRSAILYQEILGKPLALRD